jgi:hypothetical protein
MGTNLKIFVREIRGKKNWLTLGIADTRNIYESLNSIRRGIHVILPSTVSNSNTLFANYRGACLYSYSCADNNYKIWFSAIMASFLPILKLQFIIAA